MIPDVHDSFGNKRQPQQVWKDPETVMGFADNDAYNETCCKHRQVND